MPNEAAPSSSLVRTLSGLPPWARAVVPVAVAALVGAGVWWALGRDDGPAGTTGGPGGMPPLAVTAERPAMRTVFERIEAVGTLKSNEAVVVRPEIAGLVEKVHFDEGQAVAAGALLISLDSTIARAELREAEANLELSRRNFQRAADLFKSGTATARTRDEAEARLKADEARVALLRAQLEKTQIRASFAGKTGLRRVSPGAYVKSGDDLVNLEDIDPIKLDFSVPERYLTEIANGATIEVRVDALPGRLFTGTVYAIDPRIDAVSRSVAIRAVIDNADGVLQPGLFATVSLIAGTRTDALLVAEEAIVPRGSEVFVFRVVEGKALLTKVVLGWRGDGLVEVTEGLSVNDLVVTAGHTKLRDGAAVQVSTSVPGAAG